MFTIKEVDTKTVRIIGKVVELRGKFKLHIRGGITMSLFGPSKRNYLNGKHLLLGNHQANY